MNENIEKPTFKEIVLLNIQQLTNFPYIEKDFDALTDYGLLCKVVDKMNEVITNTNEQDTAIINLYNAFVSLKDYVDEEVQALNDSWSEKTEELEREFDDLHDYVMNYLTEANLQPLVNNAVNTFIQSGTINVGTTYDPTTERLDIIVTEGGE